MGNKGEIKREMAARAREIRQTLNLSQREFGEKLGRTQGLITMIESGRRWFSRDIKEKLTRIFNINTRWLENGEGDMFLPKAVRQKEQSPLQILVVPVDMQGEERVLVIPDFAMASYSDNYQDTEYVDDLPTETVPYDLRGRGTVAKFQAYGQSMEPNFHHGDSVYCTYVETDSPENFHNTLRNGYVYIVVALGRAPMLKRLYYHEGDEYIQCYSDNADQQAYAPFKIHLEEIRQLWYWRRTYTAQAPQPVEDPDEVITLKKELWESNKKVAELESNIKNINRYLRDDKKEIQL